MPCAAGAAPHCPGIGSGVSGPLADGAQPRGRVAPPPRKAGLRPPPPRAHGRGQILLLAGKLSETDLVLMTRLTPLRSLRQTGKARKELLQGVGPGLTFLFFTGSSPRGATGRDGAGAQARRAGSAWAALRPPLQGRTPPSANSWPAGKGPVRGEFHHSLVWAKGGEKEMKQKIMFLRTNEVGGWGWGRFMFAFVRKGKGPFTPWTSLLLFSLHLPTHFAYIS